MAVVVREENVEKFIKLAEEENLEAYKVAEVNDTGRLVMKYRNEVIADISRDFSKYKRCKIKYRHRNRKNSQT